jgi:hypothetical protein
MQAVMKLHRATVIDKDRKDRDGVPVTGTIKLEQGAHPVRLYVNTEADKHGPITLKWSGPGMPALTEVPADAYTQPAKR